MVRIVAATALAALITSPHTPAHAAARGGSPTPAAAPVVTHTGIRIAAVRTVGKDLPERRLVRMLGLAPGGVYDSLAVERARRRILSLGWLRDLRVNTAPLAPDSIVVVVLARRGPRAVLEPLVNWLPDERIVLGATLRVWGNSGRGERFKLRAAGLGQELVQVEWSEPRPFLRLPVSMRFFADVVREPVEPEDEIEFGRVVFGAGLGIGLGWPRLEFSGSMWDVEASDPAGLVSGDRRDTLRRGAVALVWGRPPERFGFSYLHGGVGVGATTGAAEAQDLSAWMQAGQALAGHCILTAGFLYRDARGTVPRYLRQHLGGGPSLRGHDFGVANGDGAGWGGLELRVPLNFSDRESFWRNPLSFELHFFADAGTAWRASAPGATSEAADREHARGRWSAGAGLGAYLRGAHPLRADVGRDDGGVWRVQIATALPF